MKTDKDRAFTSSGWVIAAILASSTVACAGAGEVRGSTSDRTRGGDSNETGAPVPVVVAPVTVKTVPVVITTVGTVEPIAAVEIHSQITGQLREILFTPGQAVRKGQALFVIDARPFEAALRQARAVVARDQAQASDARAQRDRAESLFARGLLPQNQLDTQRAGSAALEATIAADQAQVDQAQLNLQYTRISAPMAGRSGALRAHVGDLVRANDASPLVTINQVSPIDVAFSVPGRLLVDIHRYRAQGPLKVTATGQATTLPGAGAGLERAPLGSVSDSGEEGQAAPAAARPTAEGAVSFIDNAVDPATATIKLKATFANADRTLWPGLFVQVALQLATQSGAIVVPAVAVQASQQGQYVYVVSKNQTVEMRPVIVDRQQRDEAIIGRGLQVGEEVVTQGQLRLTPGMQIRVIRGGTIS